MTTNSSKAGKGTRKATARAKGKTVRVKMTRRQLRGLKTLRRIGLELGARDTAGSSARAPATQWMVPMQNTDKLEQQNPLIRDTIYSTLRQVNRMLAVVQD